MGLALTAGVSSVGAAHGAATIIPTHTSAGHPTGHRVWPYHRGIGRGGGVCHRPHIFVDTGAGGLMPRGVRIPDSEVSFMLGMFHRLQKEGVALTQSYVQIGEATGRGHKTVCDVIKRYLPTTDLATAVFKAGAADMARKIVKKGTVSEHIGILERPNIGVLEPVRKGSDLGDSGFQLSVSADSLGAVKVGVNIGGRPPQNTLPESNIINVTPETAQLEAGKA